MAFGSVIFVDNSPLPTEFNSEKLSDLQTVHLNRIQSAENMNIQ